MKVYLAGPLFTLAERKFNDDLRNLLRVRCLDATFILPQETSDKFLPDLKAVAEDCFKQVRECTVVVACLDGPDADGGTCVEVGYAIALGKTVIGYRTDFRAGEVDGMNAMLRYGCTEILIIDSRGDMSTLANAIATHL